MKLKVFLIFWFGCKKNCRKRVKQTDWLNFNLMMIMPMMMMMMKLKQQNYKIIIL